MKKEYSADVVNFIACLVFGADLIPITVADAAYDIQEWKKEGMDLPEDLTPEAYAEIWNGFCEVDAAAEKE